MEGFQVDTLLSDKIFSLMSGNPVSSKFSLERKVLKEKVYVPLKETVVRLSQARERRSYNNKKKNSDSRTVSNLQKGKSYLKRLQIEMQKMPITWPATLTRNVQMLDG